MKTKLELRRGLSVLTAASALLLAPLLASGQETTFEAALSGPEVSGDPDGRGEATVTVNAETNVVEVDVTHSNIAEPTAVHIREGAVGSQGGIAVAFTIDSNEEGALAGQGKADSYIVEAILASPEKYYVVVLNDEFPVGALRGQLLE